MNDATACLQENRQEQTLPVSIHIAWDRTSNARLRDELLNLEPFYSLNEVRSVTGRTIDLDLGGAGQKYDQSRIQFAGLQ